MLPPPATRPPFFVRELGLALALTTLQASAGNGLEWPGFRGPHRTGVSVEGDFPIHFGPQTNVAWKVPVPSGHSSPVLMGDLVCLTGFETNRLLVLAIDRSTAGIRWRSEIEPGRIESGSRLSHPATATSVTDGERLISYFAPFGLIAHDPAGRELWRHPLPTPVTGHGASSSPVLAGSLVIQLCDQDTDSYLLALNKLTGTVVWKVARPEFRRGFSTPLPWPPSDPDSVIVAGSLRLVSYGLGDGSERWSVRGFPNEMVASPVPGNGVVLVAGWTSGSGVSRMPVWETLITTGDPDQDGQIAREHAPAGPARQHFAYIDANRDGRLSKEEYTTIAGIFDRSENVAMSIRPDGGGDVTATHVNWRQTRGLPYVPTPLPLNDRLYLVRNGGLASCLEAATGAFRFQEERLGAVGDYYASPVAAKGKVLAISQPGTAVVFRASDTLEVLARNPLGEEVLATPAIGGDTLYVRTRSTLFAFREGGCPCDH